MALKNTAVIDLKNIRFNARAVKKLIGTDVLFCAVVKADAYGHGALAVANALCGSADMFAVALTSEGAELRCGGILKEILLLSPVTTDAERAVIYDLTLTVCDKKQLINIEKVCKKLKKTAKVHIKFNSGMNRLGCDENELIEICGALKNLKYVKVSGFYSHFHMPENSEITERQYKKFLNGKEIVNRYLKDVLYHISASGGVLTDRKYNFDMVRIGIMLYGYTPFKTDRVALKKALKIKAEILAERHISKGENLLYGDFSVSYTRDISLIRLGYADGFKRSGSGNNLNNLCMDVCAVKEADKNFYLVDDFESLAKEQNTISYETLCSVTKRSDMLYLN